MRRDHEIVEEVIVEEEIVEEVYYEDDEGGGFGGLLLGLLVLLLIGGGVAFAWHKGWLGGSTPSPERQVTVGGPAQSPAPPSGKAPPVAPTGLRPASEAPLAKRAPVKPPVKTPVKPSDTRPAPGGVAFWDGRTPFKCAGHQSFTLKDIEAKVAGDAPAITAAGDCQLTLEGVTVQAAIPLYAAGHAKVLIKGGALEGSPAIKAWGEAQVTIDGAEIKGPVDQKGRAAVLKAQP